MGTFSYDKEDIVLHPKYDNGYYRYNLSMKEIIQSINDCNYPIDSKNIIVNDNGEIISIIDYIKKHGGSEGGGTSPDPTKSYRLELSSSNGTFITEADFSSILSVTLYEDNEDVTERINEKYFKWTRVSGSTTSDQQSDAEWNLRWSQGAKEIPITKEDVKRKAVFNAFFVTEDTSEVEWVVDAYNRYIKLMNLEENK